MTRKSKIARLSRSIRDELNRRLDNGHPGLRIVEWLNCLPEVNEILTRDFQGRRITPQNLSEWKRGGYQDWLAQQEHAASLQDFLADAKELSQNASPEKLTEAIFNFALVHYAAAMQRCAYRPEQRDYLNRYSQMLNDVIRLRNCDLARERFDLDSQKLAFSAEKLEIQTQLAHLRLDIDRQRLELVRQRVELDRHRLDVTRQEARAAVNPEGVPAVSPGLRRDAGRYPGKPLPEIIPNPERVASRPDQSIDTQTFSLDPLPGTSEMPSKTPLEINTLQPNPTKSNDPFFIFSQTTTLGQASRLSPSSSPAFAVDERINADHAKSPSAISGSTEHGLSRQSGLSRRSPTKAETPNTLWLQFSNKGYNFTPRLAPPFPPQYSQPLSPEI